MSIWFDGNIASLNAVFYINGDWPIHPSLLGMNDMVFVTEYMWFDGVFGAVRLYSVVVCVLSDFILHG